MGTEFGRLAAQRRCLQVIERRFGSRGWGRLVRERFHFRTSIDTGISAASVFQAVRRYSVLFFLRHETTTPRGARAGILAHGVRNVAASLDEADGAGNQRAAPSGYWNMTVSNIPYAPAHFYRTVAQ